jgi:hypothetical protein
MWVTVAVFFVVCQSLILSVRFQPSSLGELALIIGLVSIEFLGLMWVCQWLTPPIGVVVVSVILCATVVAGVMEFISD